MRDEEKDRVKRLKEFGTKAEVTGELPRHTGYEQLAIIREKEKDHPEAIRLCGEAMAQGWNGDWEKRIQRCKAKLSKVK